DGGASITGYQVIWSPANFTGMTAATVGSATHTWIKGLQNGDPYTFQVAAENSAGFSPYSSPLSAVPGVVPAAPTNLTASVGNGTASLAWTPSPSPAGYPVLGYDLNLTGGGSSWEYLNATSPFLVNSLTDGVTYRATVRAFDALGNSPASNGTTFEPLGVPSPPIAGGANYDANHRSITIFWAPPSWDGGAAVDNYTIHWYASDGENSVGHAGPQDSNWTLDGAVAGLTYDFYVQAANRAGSSHFSAMNLTVPSASSTSPSTAPLFVLAELITVTVGVFLLLIARSRYQRNRRRGFGVPRGIARGSPPPRSPPGGRGSTPVSATPRPKRTQDSSAPRSRPEPEGPAVWPPPGG
ncbi:MAG: fibronectin type III domain-containing protein, partial [Thermoplasmata archaeon]|nr:fibronectin type III domain-containing protein [Thermoplasmata archaeon]